MRPVLVSPSSCRFALFLVAALALGGFTSRGASAHNMSPRAGVSQHIGDVVVAVDYGRPGVRGRTIWGELVPYGELWKTGADRMTNFTLSAPLVVGERSAAQELAAGTYGLLTIPGPQTWTVIITRRADIHRPSTYDPANDDVLRLEVTPSPCAMQERLEFSFADLELTSAALVLEWEKLRIAIPLSLPAGSSDHSAGHDEHQDR